MLRNSAGAAGAELSRVSRTERVDSANAVGVRLSSPDADLIARAAAREEACWGATALL